jgi:hypothetical protein
MPPARKAILIRSNKRNNNTTRFSQSSKTNKHETINMNAHLKPCIASFCPHPARAVPRVGWLVCSVLAVMSSFSDLRAQYAPGSLPWREPGPYITWGWVNKVYRLSGRDFQLLVDMKTRYGASEQMRGEFREARGLFQSLAEQLRYHDPRDPRPFSEGIARAYNEALRVGAIVRNLQAEYARFATDYRGQQQYDQRNQGSDFDPRSLPFFPASFPQN